VYGYEGIDRAEYRRRIRAWTLYDWANSAFATTILAAVLPVYYSQVAGETLPSEAVATQYWTIGLSVALFFVAVLSPILGTISDLRRGKKPLLAISAGVGIVATGLLAFVGSGDWLLASVLFVFGRVGFGAANVFYDALLPHVARPEDQDRVSSLGYALGYVGGGLLLAINVVMIFVLGNEAGARWSFLSVAVWWAVFTIPVLRRVPEPPAATAPVTAGALRASFSRLRNTLGHVRRYRELFKFLVAFLIYNDGIGTIIGVAVIYGAELGFGATELILALLLVQFVGIPFTLIFGRIPGGGDTGLGRRAAALFFVAYSMVALPIVGTVAARALPDDMVGRPGPDTATEDGFLGQGEYGAADLAFDGGWAVRTEQELGSGARRDYAFADGPGDTATFRYHGREVEITYSRGPDHGKFGIVVDGRVVLDDGEPLKVNAFNPEPRFEEQVIVDAGEAGYHTLLLVVLEETDPASTGTTVGIGGVEVLEPTRTSDLGSVLGLLLFVELVGAALAVTIGAGLLRPVAAAMTTKRTVLLALAVYTVISVWGFFLDTVVEFWFLAWMVAIVQGASQALSRSLYASMSPASMSGEFFGFFSIMEKASAILGPLVFAGAVLAFGSSRPAVLGLVAFFVVGGYLLGRVDVDEGRRVAAAADRSGAP
jgi:MFS-type transporter involved in bile tolerance (Atg22 family)